MVHLRLPGIPGVTRPAAGPGRGAHECDDPGLVCRTLVDRVRGLSSLATEGFIRFVGGIAASEVVPSLPVVLFFKIRKHLHERRVRRDLKPLISIPDSLERLSDGERLRIKTAIAKAGWNASITIGVDGEWYEVEREERGAFPRTHIYILRRAPVGKILRAYDEYDSGAAIKDS